MTNLVELLATGDLGPCRPHPDSVFELVAPRLNAASAVLGQLEPALTVRGESAPQARLAMRTPPDAARAIRQAGFSVVSLAGNHCLDWGTTGLIDTVDSLHSQDLKVVGAGPDLRSATNHATLNPHGSRISVLAFNSIIPTGYAAQANRAGCAPLRAFTHYEQIEHDQPGTPSRIHSFANREDLDALVEAIRSARTTSDAVVLSVHWGIHFVPTVIADYQREIAHAAIDAGVDVVIGHHPHIIKGIEVYRDKVIFYSLGNFAIDPPTAFDNTLRESRRHKEIVALNKDWDDDGEHTVLRDSALAIVARCLFSAGTLVRVSALPVYINRNSQPAFLRASDPRFAQVAQYLSKATGEAGLNTVFATDGDELLIQATN